ncbi:MAG: hypothetical protein ACXW1F_08310 [Halobacteriota archaeon]
MSTIRAQSRMAHDNNVSIGSVGTGNTINIAQHQAPETPHVEYTAASDSIEHLSRSTVNRGAVAFIASLSFPILAIVADGLGVLSSLGVQTKWQVLAVLVAIAIVGTVLTKTKMKIATKTFKSNQAWFIDGRWVEREDDGNYVIYRKTAPCIYEKCSGTVFIQPAPPREQPNHTLVGVCDVGARQHTYTVDFNNIGFPARFDWRPLEERKL